MPVGTRGAIRGLDADDLEALGVEMVLANTYHLMLQAGRRRRRGSRRPAPVHRVGADRCSPTPAASRCSRCGRRSTTTGVTFRSAYDGSTHRLTPERAVRIQEQLGADIQMVLDVCPPLPSPHARRAHRGRPHGRVGGAGQGVRTAGADQALFGIVQGGVDETLRVESAERTVAIGFDGYAIGGLSVGERRDEMVPALRAATGVLPADRVRYLMGVGDPVGLVEAVAAGVDMFDCVLPTRHGRHGTVLTDAGRLNLRNARFAADDGRSTLRARAGSAPGGRGPTSATCCRSGSRPGPRLVTVHNVAWTLRFVEAMRDAPSGPAGSPHFGRTRPPSGGEDRRHRRRGYG